MTPPRSVEEFLVSQGRRFPWPLTWVQEACIAYAAEQVADKEAYINTLKAMLVEQDKQVAQARADAPFVALAGKILDRVEKSLNAASEERYRELKDWEAEARKWQAEGDMYGWNFHQGMAAGANWCDILYRRIGREVETIRKEIIAHPALKKALEP